MSRGPYTIIPLADPGVGQGYARLPKQLAITREDARVVVRAEYDARGVIPDVFDAHGRAVQIYSNEEVAKWGLK